jgi:hypothetical protein
MHAHHGLVSLGVAYMACFIALWAVGVPFAVLCIEWIFDRDNHRRPRP